MTEEAELLQALIRNACVNDGTNPVGEQPNADVITSLIEGCGADLEVVDAGPGRRSLVARVAGTDPDAPALMLLAHTDVVPAGGGEWSRDPFAGEIVDDFVWGRGAIDMLGYVATMGLAYRDHVAAGARPKGDIVFAAIADEEALGDYGAAWLLDHEPGLMKADWVLTESGGTIAASPSGRRVTATVAEKGVWRLRLNVRGTSGHAALPYGSPNALVLAARACTLIEQAHTPVHVSAPWEDFVRQAWDESMQGPLLSPRGIDKSLPFLPELPARVVHAMTRMTIVVTGIHASPSWNSIPGHATVELDVRVVEGQSITDVLAFLTEAMEPIAAHVTIDVLNGNDANSSPWSSALWSLAQDATRVQYPDATLLPSMSSGVTDARFFRQRGITSYGIGLLSPEFPMDDAPTMVHGVDERIDLASLSMMRRLWSDILTGHSEIETR